MSFFKIKSEESQLFFWYAFCFFLPLSEALKNIFSVFFIFITIYCFCLEKKNITGISRYICIGLITLILSALISGLGSQTYFFRNNLNWILLPLTSFCFFLAPTNSIVLIRTCQIILIGGIVAIIESLIGFDGNYPELRSVGHVNHSSMYCLYLVFTSMLLFNFYRNNTRLILGISAIVLSISFIMLSRSVTSMVGLALSLPVMIQMFLLKVNRSELRLALFFFTVLVGFVALTLGESGADALILLSQEIAHKLSGFEEFMSQRDKMLYSSWVVGHDSILGNGISSYEDALNFAFMESNLGGKEAEIFSNFVISNHAHNIFGTWLVERGWLGVFIGLFWLTLLVFMGIRLWRVDQYLSSLTLQLVVGTVICGLSQTLLVVEHGQLFFILIVVIFKLAELEGSEGAGYINGRHNTFA